MNPTTTDTYLKFIDNDGETHLVSIESILEGGYPIDSENGDDMELVSNILLDYEGNPIA